LHTYKVKNFTTQSKLQNYSDLIVELSVLLEKITKTLDDAKAHDLINIDLNHQSSIADNMLICTGTSNRHVSAIAQRLVDNLYKDGLKQIRVSGEQLGEWVIVDTGTVMVHIMQQEVRERYELDDLYKCMAAGTDAA
jgi:ribosome-associated protein